MTHRVRIEFTSHRILHPRVSNKNPPCRNGCTKTGEPCRCEMESLRYLLPTEEHHGNEGALHEESHNAFDSERRTKDVAHYPRVVAPVCSELELKDNSGGHTHCKVHSEKFLPKAGSVFPKLFPRAVIARFCDAHDECQTKCEWHKEPVINGSKRKLRPCPIHRSCIDCKK